MTVVNRVGFPIVVCAWLAYQQFVSDREQLKMMVEFKEVLISLKTSLEQNNRMMRRRTE